MERAPLRPVPARPAGPVDPAMAMREVGAWVPTLPPLAAEALALVVLSERPRAEVAVSLGVSEEALAKLLAAARKELRQTVVTLGGSGWCERAEGLISDRLDGILAGRDTRRLDVHLRNCPRCVEHERRLVQATDALVGRVSGARRGPAPPGEAVPLAAAEPPDDGVGEGVPPAETAPPDDSTEEGVPPAEAAGAKNGVEEGVPPAEAAPPDAGSEGGPEDAAPPDDGSQGRPEDAAPPDDGSEGRPEDAAPPDDGSEGRPEDAAPPDDGSEERPEDAAPPDAGSEGRPEIGTGDSPAISAPREAAPDQAAPRETVPAEAAPAEAAPAETAPAETAPAETAAPEAAPPEIPSAEAAPTREEVAPAAEVPVASRTRGQVAAALVWNSLIGLAILLTLATIALTIAGILGARL